MPDSQVTGVCQRQLPRQVYRIPVISSGLVNLYTRDIEASIVFYRDLLGLRESFRTPSGGEPEHVEFVAGGFTIGLGTVDAARQAHGVAPTPGAPSMAIVLWTNDVDETYARLAAAGVPTIREPRDTGNDNRNALVRDPDHNLVELVSKRA